MAWKKYQYQLTGDAPLLMHSGRMANPLDPWAKLMKQVSSKRKKSDADHEQMARIEFLASLYMGDDGPILPAYCIDAMLVTAAKRRRDGIAAKSGTYCYEHARLEYAGPREVEALWQDEQFRHVALVRVGTARVVRTRPVFKAWSAVVGISIETGIVNPAQVDDWLAVAGAQVGLCDWRPQYGRFSVVRIP